jgi:hypothetical protein
MNEFLFLSDKNIKPGEKTGMLSQLLLSKKVSMTQLIEFASNAKDPVKATCIEALEFATKGKPDFADKACLKFVIGTLTEKAPRIKWESARVIGNIAHLFPSDLDDAINNLLINTEHIGTVVRWSAAFALGQIIKLKTSKNKILVPAVKAIIEREEKNSIKKIYLEALKKSGL